MKRTTSAVHDVDGSSTGTRVARKWELLELPRFGGVKCKRSRQSVSISPNRSFRCLVWTLPAKPCVPVLALRQIHFADQHIAPAADCEVAREQYRMAWGGYGCRGTEVEHVV